MSTFEEVVAGAFTQEQTAIIEASAQMQAWYDYADRHVNEFLEWISGCDLPMFVVAQVLEDNARLLKEAIEEAGEQDD